MSGVASEGRVRMPAEWEPHERCLMAWPVRDEIWFGRVDDARQSYAEIANTIVEFEPVTMVVPPGGRSQARRWLRSSIEVIELPLDDSWTRDTGPIVVVDAAGRRTGVDFRFNSWGRKFLPFADDARLAGSLLEHLGIARTESTLVLEGGAIAVDGAGLLLTTAQCIDHPNRNPERSPDQIDDELRRRLRVVDVVRLPFGLAEDWHTDGHVDMVAAFARSGAVVAQTCGDPSDPNHDRLAANLAVLRATTDVTGRPLDVIEMPHLPSFTFGGESHRLSHVNAYLANGAVVVPVVGSERSADTDTDALRIWADACPDRQVVGVPATTVFAGGGGIHCITQHVPAAP